MKLERQGEINKVTERDLFFNLIDQMLKFAACMTGECDQRKAALFFMMLYQPGPSKIRDLFTEAQAQQMTKNSMHLVKMNEFAQIAYDLRLKRSQAARDVQEPLSVAFSVFTLEKEHGRAFFTGEDLGNKCELYVIRLWFAINSRHAQSLKGSLKSGSSASPVKLMNVSD